MQNGLIDFTPRYMAYGSITIQENDLEKIPESEGEGFLFNNGAISHVFDKEKKYKHTLINGYRLGSN